jgi:prepilin-type N-terminal cleavage/methylation domain-containing protein
MERGFTLIELALVWAMAAVLTTVALPYWKAHLADVREAKELAASTYHKTPLCLWYDDMAGTRHFTCRKVTHGG